VALYDHGLIDVMQPAAGYSLRRPEYDLVVRAMRFDQVRHVEQHRESETVTPLGAGRVVAATSAAARIVGEHDGEPLVLEFRGYRHQDRFVDAVRAHRAGRPTGRSQSQLRRAGQKTYGNLVIGKKGLSVTDGVGLGPAEEPTLRWSDVVRVHESESGAVSIYRRGRPGERAAAPDTSMLWYSGMVPNAADAAAMITELRNKALA
jgi:hypothetical protein